MDTQADLTERAKKVISKILYITIASVSKNGEPWNSPVYSAFDEVYNFFWASDQNGQHSQNIRANNNVFLVIYDSTVPAGTGFGVYFKAKAYELTDEKEMKHAAKYLYKREGRKPRSIKEFQGDYPRRLYKAVPEKVWVNGDGDVNGNFIDIRIPINLLNKK